MSGTQPQGEPLRKAVKWISERRQEPHCPPGFKLVEEACLRFNLTPADAEFLQRFLRGEK
jgi:hypothetical protein